MDVKVSLNDEVTIIKNITDKHNFSYYDKQHNLIDFELNDSEIIINFLANDHSTTLIFNETPVAQIKSKEGLLNFSLKDVAINSNFGIISIVYKIDAEIRSIKIEYLGV